MANYKYKIKKIYQPNVEVLMLELGDPSGAPIFNFKPGQYVMIAYVDEQGNLTRKHAFSVASSPTEKSCLRLGIKIGGKFTQHLAKLKVGETIFVSGPFGRLTFDATKHQNLVVIAGGIGITPFFSTLKYVTDKQLPNKLFLIYSNRTIDRTLFYQEINSLAQSNQNIRTLFTVTEDKSPNLPKSLLTERLNGTMIKDFVGEPRQLHYFLCGPEKFMAAINQCLLELGVEQSQIEKEGFSMIAGSGFWANLKNLSYTAGFSTLLVLLAFYFVNAAASSSAVTASAPVAVSTVPIGKTVPVQKVTPTPAKTLSATVQSTPTSVVTAKPTPTPTPMPIPTPAPTPAPAPAPVTAVS